MSEKDSSGRVRTRIPRAGRVCEFPSCDRPLSAQTLCDSHHKQRLRGEELREVKRYIDRGDHLDRNANNEKRCQTCRKWRPEDRYSKQASAQDGLARTCKECYRERRVEKTYGITADVLRRMLESQGHGCAICGAIFTAHRRVMVDHDHACCPDETSCGRCVRGLLCGACNRGLGMFDDNPQRLLIAAGYVEAL